MPDNELMLWTSGLTKWLSYYENSYEASSYYDSKCPEHLRDDPEMFNQWIQSQRELEKQKMQIGRR